MASDLEAWWTLNFSKFSIRELQRLPVYHRFLQLHYPYERVDDRGLERFTVSEDEDAFEWTEGERKERFSHDKKLQQFHYQASYPSKNCSILVNSYVKDQEDWGFVVKKFSQWELREGWRYAPPSRYYERFTVEQGITRGIRCGVTPIGPFEERWVEETWEQADESFFKRSWEKPGQSGGESKMRKLEYTWGEDWYSDSEKSETKCWHEEHQHKWGYSGGKEGRDQRWEHQWDIDTGRKFEERISYKADRALGYRYRAKDADWYKQEWEGMGAIPGETPWDDTEGTKAAARIEKLYDKEYTGALQSDRTLRLLLLGAPAYSKQVTNLMESIARVHSSQRKNTLEILTRIEELRDIQDQQEALKQTMGDSQSSNWKLFSAFISSLKDEATDSLATLSQLTQILQSDEVDSLAAKLKSDIDKAAAATDDNFNGQMNTWKTILVSLESAKREHLPLLQRREAKGFAKSVLEQMMRKQHLEQAIQTVYAQLNVTYGFARDLGSMVGDERAQGRIEVLKKEYEATFAGGERSPVQLMALLGTLKDFDSVQADLLAALKDGAGGRAGQHVNELQRMASEVVPQVQEMTDELLEMVNEQPVQAMSAQEATVDWDETASLAGSRSEKPLSLSQGVTTMKNGLGMMRSLLKKAVKHAGTNNKALQLLAPLIQDTHLLAEELTTFNPPTKEQLQTLKRDVLDRFPESPLDSDLFGVLEGLKLYITFLRKVVKDLTSGEAPNPIVQEAMRMLEPTHKELSDVATTLGAPYPEYSPQLGNFQNEAATCFSDFRKSNNGLCIFRGISALQAYFPLMREMIRKPRQAASTEVDEGEVKDAMEELQYALTELNDITVDMTEGDTDLQAKVRTLESQNSGTKEGKVTLSDLVKGIRALRAYHPVIREIGRKSGVRAALEALEAALTDTHRDAEEHTGLNADLAAELQSLQLRALVFFKDARSWPNKSQFTQGLTVLRAYFPYFLHLLGRKGVKDLEALAASTHDLATDLTEASTPQPREKLAALQQTATTELANYKQTPSAHYLQTSLQAVAAYLPFMRALLKKITSGETLPPAVVESMAMLEALQGELAKVASEMSESDPSQEPRLKVLREDSAQGFAEFKQNPSLAALPKSVGTLSGYSPVLQELAKQRARPKSSSEDPSLVAELLSAVEPMLYETTSLAFELSEGEPEHQEKIEKLKDEGAATFRAPASKATMLRAIGSVRAYHPILRQLVGRAGLGRSMKLLESALDDTHREAEEIASEHSDLRTDTERLREVVLTLFKEYRSAPKRDHLQRGVAALRAYFPFFRGGSWRPVMKLLRPIVEDMHQLATELAEVHPESKQRLPDMHREATAPFQPRSTDTNPLPAALKAFKPYIPFIRSLGKGILSGEHPHPIFADAMRLLGTAPKELEELGVLLSHQDAVHRSRLRGLDEAAVTPFREYKRAPQYAHLLRAITAIQAYYPVFKELAKTARPRAKPAATSAEPVPENFLIEAMDELKTTSAEMKELALSIADGDTTHESKLQGVARDVSKPFKDSRRVPKTENILHAIRVLRTYHPLLLELSRKAGAKQVMELIESALTETHREAVGHVYQDSTADEELEKLKRDASVPIRDFKAAPRHDHLRQALAALCAYHPFFRSYSWRYALRLLEPVLKDVHDLAKELAQTTVDKERLSTLRSDAKVPYRDLKTAPKNTHLPQALTALRAYFPFIRALAGAKGGIQLASIEAVMKALEQYPVDLEEITRGMLEGEQSTHPRLNALREEAAVPFREFKAAPDFNHLPRAITTIRNYHHMMKELLKKFRERTAIAVSHSLEEIMKALEPSTKGLDELAKEMAEDDPARDPQIRELREGAEAAFREHRASASEATAIKAILSLRAYHPVLKDWVRKSGFRSVMELLEPILLATHQEATELAGADLTIAFELRELEANANAPVREYHLAPKRGQVAQALAALRAYHPFFRRYSWRFTLKRLEPIMDQAHELAEESAPNAVDQLVALRSDVSTQFTEHRTAPKLLHVQNVVRLLGQYLELLQKAGADKQPADFTKGRQSVGGPPHFSVTEAMNLLEPSISELEEAVAAMSDNDPSYTQRLQTLRTDATAPFEEYRKSPQHLHLPRAISAVRAYHPLLKDLLRKLKEKRPADDDSTQLIEDAMKELEGATLDLNGLALEMTEGETTHEPKVSARRDTAEETFREHRREPKRGNLLRAAREVRAYYPLLRELLQNLGSGYAMSVLEPFVAETHKEAVEMTSGEDLEYADELLQLERNAAHPFREFKKTPRRLYYPQALASLRAYHPFFRKYWWRRSMKLLERTIPEFDRILVRRYPSVEVRVIPLREKVLSTFRKYRTGFMPSHLPFAVELLQTYHRLLEDVKEEEKAQSPAATPTSTTEPDMPLPFVVEASAANELQADDFISREKRNSIANNVIIHSLQRANVAAEKPLAYLNIFKFFEELMDRKLEVDTQDLKANRRPREMTEFLMEHLNRQFGIRPLALKFLGQLIPGLQILYNENNPYAILFARLLQVFHPDPVPSALAIFLTRMRVEFHKLVEKCTRERELRDKRMGTKGKKGDVTYGRAAYEVAVTGGEAFTAEVITMIYDLFDNDPKSGELALKLLKPEGISMSNYVVFKLCHKMAKMGLTPDAVFNLIDADGGGSIDADEFVKGIKESLELWISETDIREVYDEIAEYGELSRTEFCNRCKFDWFLSVVKSEEFITTKCHFLNVLINVFEKRQRDDMAKLIAMFENAGEDPLTKDTFANLVKSLDPNNTPERIERIWKAGKEDAKDSEGLTQIAFVKCMLRFPSGKFAETKFCKHYADIADIEKAIEERRMETVDVDLSEVSSKKAGAVIMKSITTAKAMADKQRKLKKSLG